MQQPRFRNLAQGLCVSAVVAMVFASPSSFASTAPIAKPSEFAKERAMSASQLIERWAPYIKEASRRFGVAEDWIRAVMRMESGGRAFLDKKPITSRAGAMGLMQVMPGTYRDMRQQHGLGADPFNPRDNVLAGAAYLGWLHEKYGYPKMFAAYNAGPATLEAQLAGARQLPGETRDYVRGIAAILGVEAPQSTPSSSPPVKIVATFTRPDGSPITFDGDSVKSIRAVLPNEFVSGVQTVVATGDREQGVREDFAAVKAALKRPANTPTA